MTDTPDWQPDYPLITALNATTAAVNALVGGFGASTSGWATARFQGTISGASVGTLVAAPPGKIVLMGYIFSRDGNAKQLRGWVNVLLRAHGGAVVVEETLTEERASCGLIFPPESIQVATATALDYDFGSFYGTTSAELLSVQAFYYLKP